MWSKSYIPILFTLPTADSWYRKPQDSAPVCIIIDISPEMAAQSVQPNQAFRVTASDWSPIITNVKALH